MAQLHCYVPDEIAEKFQKKVQHANMSVSNYMASLIKKETDSTWADNYFDFFGSVIKGDTFVYNDVDIVIEMEKPDLFFMVHINDELEEALDCPVDIIHYCERMNPFLKKRINKEAVYV